MLSKIRRLDPVLVIAGILAVISSVLVHPDAKYIDYIDVRTLAILWSLMIIVQGLTVNGVFERIARYLMRHINRVGGMAVVLVLLCFLGSMLITNDVALITFVPFSILILEKSNRENLALPVIVLQTLAANLGSMLTPIGNPQNLYLYGIMKSSPIEFLMIMLPFTLLSLVLLIAAVFFIPAMPYLLSFAAGAMMYVVVEELIPEMSEGEHSNVGVIMFSAGFTLMMALDVALG
jgi:Na+/H+ antiporter NhaD/arsenite permease-like protein